MTHLKLRKSQLVTIEKSTNLTCMDRNCHHRRLPRHRDSAGCLRPNSRLGSTRSSNQKTQFHKFVLLNAASHSLKTKHIHLIPSIDKNY